MTKAAGAPGTMIPGLRYTDCPAASAFGFEATLVVPREDGAIRHAQLRLGGGTVMVGTSRDDGALAAMEEAGQLTGLITQNVDRLHQTAGSQAVVELHGALAEVICLDCADLSGRAELQRRLAELNPDWRDRAGAFAPDGDADVEQTDTFEVAGCVLCGGRLKPHVVFFGEGVPRARVDRSFAWVDEADALLVVGSSLTVFSGYRFVRHATRRGLPVAILNLGPTRGDGDAAMKVEAPAGELLPVLARALSAPG